MNHDEEWDDEYDDDGGPIEAKSGAGRIVLVVILLVLTAATTGFCFYIGQLWAGMVILGLGIALSSFVL